MKKTLLILIISYILCQEEEEWIDNPKETTPTDPNPVYPEYPYPNPQNQTTKEEDDFIDDEKKKKHQKKMK